MARKWIQKFNDRYTNVREEAWNGGLSVASDALVKSRFSVHPDNRRSFIWRDRSRRNNPAFMHESVRFGGGGELVPHRANLVEDFLFEEGIVRMEWPACSPDMNPIGNVWDALGRRVAGHQPPPQTLQELESALLEEWDRIPPLVINSIIDSMPQRCSTLLAVRGNHTPY
ncbi:transposable element Tcb2 transposase [Trichonephila clavipes]|uniref:Transposable element Tcb2 transposase n=1 Tax=Trichonephila clavipes TaxID=2585209 RepID=A0A8X6UTB6_TRICX|nr:transposable element Tcb2 transposase [Trichonephila clavipes]